MSIIAISNGKGGVGKSVSTIIIGEVSAGMGKNTLVIDAGHQSTTGNHYLENNVAVRKDRNLLKALTGEIKPKDAIINIRENLSLVPGTIDMVNFDDKIKIKQKDLVLKAVMFPIFKDYDNVIFDSESNLGSLNRNVYNVAEIAIIPIYDGESTKKARITADNIKALSPNVKQMYILPVMRRRFSKAFRIVMSEAKETLDDIPFLPEIGFYDDLFIGNYNKAIVSGKVLRDYKKSIGGLL